MCLTLRGPRGFRHAKREPRLSALHLHDLIHRHHVVVEVRHDPERAGHEHENDQHAEGECQDVVDVVRAGGDVQEEDEMDARLEAMFKA